jgi:hypothetical protein
VGSLFQVLQTYGGENAAADLEELVAKWNYYATMALADLPAGQGIATLAGLASIWRAKSRLPTQDSFKYPNAATSAQQESVSAHM